MCLEPLTGTVVQMGCCHNKVHIQCYFSKCPLCRSPLPLPRNTEPNQIIVPVPVAHPRANTGPKNHGRVPRSRHPLCRRTDYGSSEYTPRLNIVLARLQLVLAFSFPLTSQCVRQLVYAIPHDATRWCVLGIVTDVMGLTNGSFNILGRQLTWRNRFCNRQYVHYLLRDDTFYYVK